MANELVQSVLTLGCSIAFILIIVAIVAKDAKLDDVHMVNTKGLKKVCGPTEYTDACYYALRYVAKNESATKKDYIFASFNSTVYELKKAAKKAGTIKKKLDGQTDDYAKYARADLSNCEKLLGYASEDIEHIVKVSRKAKIDTLAEQKYPLLVWLTAARAYQTTCIDEIKDADLKKNMTKKLYKAKKNTYNCEKIIYNIVEILTTIGVDMSKYEDPSASHHRRLLDEGGRLGFPSWVPVGDRRILGGGGCDTDTEAYIKDDYDNGPAPKSQDFFKSSEPEAIKDNVKPNVVVAQDGSGDYKTIKEAIDSYPKDKNGSRFIIHIKSGTYDEGQLVVNRTQHNVYMYGDGSDKTIITGKLNYAEGNVATSQTATFLAQGERFIARDIGFQNTFGPEGAQAVAFGSQSPHTVMVDCSFEGYQDTIYYHVHDQFYKNCNIYGTTDIIQGSGRAFFQDSKINLRVPEKGKINTILSDGRLKYVEAAGVVLHNCKILATDELKSKKKDVKSYLGRPWRTESKAMVMKTEIEDVIEPEGWAKMDTKYTEYNHETCMFREYGNKGPGAKTNKRVDWSNFKVLKKEKWAKKFAAEKFMDAGSWVPNAGVSVNLKV